jgi:sugar phosphate isomerase/epimerase
MTLPISLQLYTLRDDLANDFVGTLEQVSKIGYTAVEFAGYGGYDAKKLSHILKEYNLTASSSHISLKDLKENLEYIIEYNHGIGSKYIVCPWVVKELYTSKESYQRLGDTLDSIGRVCKENRILFCYHNHDFEFQIYDGQYAMDILLDHTDPRHVGLELDIYWAEYAGVPAVDYILKQADRCKIVHLKDMANSPQREFSELGNGTINIMDIIKTSKKVGVQWGVVEQDICKRPALESVKISYNYLRTKGVI